MLKDKGNIQVLKVDRRFITLFKLFFRGEEIKSSEMRIFFEILVRIGSFQPQSNNCIALSSSELVCGLPPPPPPPPPHGSSNTFCPFASDWDRTSDDRLRDKRLSSHATNSANKLKKLYDNDWYEPSFRGKFITDLIQMIGLHDASWIRRLTQQANLSWFR